MRDYAAKESILEQEAQVYRRPRPTPRRGEGRRFFRVMFKILGGGFFLGTLFTLGYWGFQMVGSLPYFDLKEVILEGGKHINAQELAAKAGITPSQNLLFFNLREVRRKILQNPWVEEATVRRRFPDTLIIKVKEREPAGLIQINNSSKCFLVSIDGVVLEDLTAGARPELPLIMGLSSGQAKLGEALPYENLGQSFSLIGKINAHSPAPLGRIKEAHIRSDGSLMLITAYMATPLYVKSENFPAQWPLLQQFLEEQKNSRGTGRRTPGYEYIDLRFTGKVVTKPHKSIPEKPKQRR